jgi:hypothetical protein
MTKQIVWQPSLGNGRSNHEFSINLDGEFAKKMIRTKMPDGIVRRLNQLANETLKEIGVNWLNPYTFERDSCFLSQIYLGQNGLWLSTSYRDIEDLGREDISSKSVVYNSHNVDYSLQAYSLIRMFDLWIHYSDVLMESKH